MTVEKFPDIGILLDSIVVTGRGAKSPFWMQLQADFIGKPMLLPQTTDASVLGAALLAGVGSSIYQNLESSVTQVCHNIKVYEPDPKASDRYDHIFPIYRDLYDAVVGINSRLSDLSQNRIHHSRP